MFYLGMKFEGIVVGYEVLVGSLVVGNVFCRCAGMINDELGNSTGLGILVSKITET